MDGAQLHLDHAPGSRRSAGGELLQWLICGVAEAADQPGLPLLIQWGDGTALALSSTDGPIELLAGSVG
jgi:hypothetical protein